MILTIDIGNTNIVMGCFHKDQLLFLERFSTEQDSTSLEYATIIREMLDLHEITPAQIRGGIISSVVPSVTNTVREAAEKFTGARMLVVGPGIKTGIKLAVDDPAQQGQRPDRRRGGRRPTAIPSLRLSSTWVRLPRSLSSTGTRPTSGK